MSLSITVANTQARLQVSRHEQPANDAASVPASAPHGVDALGNTAATALSALLGALGASREPRETAGAAPAAEPSEPASVKPNLDALHRVLAHYAAQSAAADTIISLVKP